MNNKMNNSWFSARRLVQCVARKTGRISRIIAFVGLLCSFTIVFISTDGSIVGSKRLLWAAEHHQTIPAPPNRIYLPLIYRAPALTQGRALVFVSRQIPEMGTERLYNPRFGDQADSRIQVEAATVVLYRDEAATQEVARNRVGQLSVSGTNVPFADIRAQAVRVIVDDVTGTFETLTVAGLAEVEVIVQGEAAE